jgi:DNA repair exonuclease SbcCD ATPase subunit
MNELTEALQGATHLTAFTDHQIRIWEYLSTWDAATDLPQAATEQLKTLTAHILGNNLIDHATKMADQLTTLTDTLADTETHLCAAEIALTPTKTEPPEPDTDSENPDTEELECLENEIIAAEAIIDRIQSENQSIKTELSAVEEELCANERLLCEAYDRIRQLETTKTPTNRTAYEQRRARGECTTCGLPGHFRINCPDRPKPKTASASLPPPSGKAQAQRN